MSKKLRYIPGDHWVQCQRSGKIIRASEARREWTGLIVCKEYWEPRHPQDFVRARPDRQLAKGLINPETPDRYLDGSGACSITGVSAVAGFATAGCSIAGNSL